MATPLKGNTTTGSGSTVRLQPPIRQDEVDELRLSLVQALQTSLDIKVILETFFHQAQALVTCDGLQYDHLQQHCKILIGKESLHHIDYQLNTKEDDLGSITFSRSRRFTEAELMKLESIIPTLVFPLRNALQYRQAIQAALRDPLTGAGNRVAMDNTLSREILLAARHNQDLSILVIDIDHFKKINDKHGHTCGDDVLRQVVSSIETLIRQTDLTFRYGGEEFVVVLNKTGAEGARHIAERIRAFIKNSVITTQTEPVEITVSIGCSTLIAGEDSRGLFQRADAALYEAKKSGRNRVESASLD